MLIDQKIGKGVPALRFGNKYANGILSAAPPLQNELCVNRRISTFSNPFFVEEYRKNPGSWEKKAVAIYPFIQYDIK